MLPRLAAVITAILGLVVLAGWAFAVPVLKSVLSGAVVEFHEVGGLHPHYERMAA